MIWNAKSLFALYPLSLCRNTWVREKKKRTKINEKEIPSASSLANIIKFKYFYKQFLIMQSNLCTFDSRLYLISVYFSADTFDEQRWIALDWFHRYWSVVAHQIKLKRVVIFRFGFVQSWNVRAANVNDFFMSLRQFYKLKRLLGAFDSNSRHALERAHSFETPLNLPSARHLYTCINQWWNCYGFCIFIL